MKHKKSRLSYADKIIQGRTLKKSQRLFADVSTAKKSGK